jgi:hypothetical protein
LTQKNKTTKEKKLAPVAFIQLEKDINIRVN